MSTVAAMKLEFGSHSETGPRENNEDVCLISGSLIVICDGMGGHVGGEIAADLAAREVVRQIGLKRSATGDDLCAAVQQANFTVLKQARERGLRGMGCTLTAGLVCGDELWVAHVGDTRLSVILGDQVCPLTSDHNVPGQLVKQGRISMAEAREHPASNMLLNSVGSVDMAIDRVCVRMVPGAVYLFTTDGIHDVLDEAQLVAATARRRTASSIARAVVRAAISAGARDNATAGVICTGSRKRRARK